ncbi:uncharacterized protein J8A68_005601 [[Candida] subhashii]|uniref:Uncharacterized protein n=1 Tax=[Candida] subhashii TaxID=561895 RepID=A0A8J5QGS6_9ASCO|nr:uncharacterized protein J8A68_005601 [[Candida] subhashii]KAG7660926.1 hypothetical protein J8A68_005601 [[Candida] subhashii]
MQLLYQTYHDIRFNVDHFIVGYRQRYYSLNKNPRVIQTKLHNQQLISLRTFPRDKYIVEPTGFLSLGNENANDSGNDEIEETASFTVYDIDELISFDESCVSIPIPDYENNNSSREIQGPDCLKGDRLISLGNFPEEQEFQEEELVEEEGCHLPAIYPVQDPPCSCSCHKISVVPIPKEDNSRKIRVKDRFIKFVRSNINKVASKESDSGSNEQEPSIEIVLDEAESLDRDQEVPANKISQIVSNFSFLTSRGDSTIGVQDEEIEENDREEEQEEVKTEKVWKLVLNDVSLSAARLSTGNAAHSIVSSHNIRGDFIDAKSSCSPILPRIANNENDDIFAINLEHAKSKYAKDTSKINSAMKMNWNYSRR